MKDEGDNKALMKRGIMPPSVKRMTPWATHLGTCSRCGWGTADDEGTVEQRALTHTAKTGHHVDVAKGRSPEEEKAT